ncbi:MAG: hypothetical protein ABDH29_01260 [Aquificaceae bacterium]
MKLVLSLLSSLLLLFADFVVAKHHHEDHELHIDCSLCILQHSQIDNTTHKPTLKLNLILHRFEKDSPENIPEIRPVSKHFQSRAPPLL